MVKIRLQREGKKKAPFYHIVVADSKSPRDGKIIEQIGTYDPMTEPSTVVVDTAKVEKWIKNGAKPTDTVKALIEKLSKQEEQHELDGEKSVVFEVKVAESDMGKIIGKQGKLAKSIRTLMKAIAAKEQKKVSIEFIG